MPGQLKVDEIVDTAGTGPVSAINGLKTNSITNIAGTAGFPLMRLETAKTATGTSVDFTGIPSWAKKITVMLSGVSTNGTSPVRLRVGSGTISSSGYSSQGWSASGYGVVTDAFSSSGNLTAALLLSGHFHLSLLHLNTWSVTGIVGLVDQTSNGFSFVGTSPNLSGALDRLQLTTSNGTDTFDAGTVNILIEGY